MENYQLKNIMEGFVIRKAEELLKNQNLCSCKKCILDVAAIALNRLPPKYVVTSIGEVYSKVNMLLVQFETDILTAILKGIELVRENPHR